MVVRQTTNPGGGGGGGGNVSSEDIDTIEVLTRATYDALTPVATTMYVFSDASEHIVHKTADTSRTSTATPADDPHLTFPVGANETWVWELHAHIGSDASLTPDFRMDYTLPAGATGRHAFRGSDLATASATSDSRAVSTSIGTALVTGISNSSDMYAIGSGFVEVDSTAGNVTLQWSQQVSDAAATILRKGTFIRAWRVAV